MVDFNPDGSIRWPAHMQAKKDRETQQFSSRQCVRIKREVVNFEAPKKCVLKVALSPLVLDERFMATIHDYFKQSASTPTKLTKTGDREFEIEVGTDFRRCSDCTSLRNRYKGFLPVIDEKGNCTYQERSFAYEDYFD